MRRPPTSVDHSLPGIEKCIREHEQEAVRLKQNEPSRVLHPSHELRRFIFLFCGPGTRHPAMNSHQHRWGLKPVRFGGMC